MSRFRLYKFSCAVMVLLLAAFMCLTGTNAFSQATVATGSVQGIVTDPQGAVVPGAKVTITNTGTGQALVFNTTSAGAYNTGALVPGNYKVRVEAKGFQSAELPVVVQIGVVSNGSIKMQLGQESQTVTVEANAVAVNTEQATIQGVITRQQINNLPFNGRNFLDLAQLEPGVQIEDGQNFDPTKNGFSSISFGGRAGRTARIEVDGLDVSDETVGTTTQNISADSIQEFQAAQSSLDISTELTSSGTVNVLTRSGTNTLHGSGFYLFRDKNAGIVNFPGGQDLPFQRNDFGGSLGGPIWRDKVFFFADAEHIKQDSQQPVVFGPPLNFNAAFTAPFRDTEASGKLDWTLGNLGFMKNARAFYKFTYEVNRDVAPFSFGGPSTSPFENRDNTPSHAIGLDFTTGNFTHSFRLGYLKFHNLIVDAVRGSSIFDPDPRLEIFLGTAAETGPNLLAPQATYQSDKQGKYDGTYTFGNHVLRFGVDVNKILGGGFAKFFSIAPNVASDPGLGIVGNFPGGAANVLNYPVLAVTLGNGEGFFTKDPGFNLPAGGQFDTRFGVYFGDSWKILPNFTFTGGIRYDRDTGRSDSQFAPVTCSEVNAANFGGLVPCTGSALLLDQFGFIPGLGDRVRQPNGNLGGQLGFAWDPWKDGKTSVRAGIGLYYENAIFNNILFDQPGRLQSGLFFGTSGPCPSGKVTLPNGTVVTSIDGLNIKSQICGAAIGSVGGALADLQALFQSATIAAGARSNGNFIGNTLANGGNSTGNNFFAPGYQTPRSVQMNVGIQRQLARGMVLSVDYLRNVQTHFLLGVDTNHVGDSRFLNKAAALNAISLTNAAMGCGAGTDTASINCAITAGATIGTYAANGLGSGNQVFSGLPASAFGFTPATGAAFAGINPLVGQNIMLFPIGRSVYNGLDVKLTQNVGKPLQFMHGSGLLHNLNLQAAYSLSRFVNTAGVAAGLSGDQDFINTATDARNPTGFIGPNALDRTHQFSVGAILDLPKDFRYSLVAHWDSPLSTTLTMLNQSRPDEIFHTDLTGDGTVGDVITGTQIGDFGRGISGGNINNTINNFNNTVANGLTPAGQALVNAGLFSQAQLIALGATPDKLALAPANEANLDTLKQVDMKLSVPIKIGERFVLEPSFSAFNVFNFVNFDAPGNHLTGVLSAAGNTANGTPDTITTRTNRIGTGSGVFQLGAPRQLEFGLRLTF